MDYAEQVVTAFWRAIGGDEEELKGQSSDEGNAWVVTIHSSETIFKPVLIKMSETSVILCFCSNAREMFTVAVVYSLSVTADVVLRINR